MDISKSISKIVAFLALPGSACDQGLDALIQDALTADVAGPLPNGAWERLRSAIGEPRPIRSQRGGGMWILNEPFRDPPESFPTALTQAQMRQVRRLVRGAAPNTHFVIRQTVWNDNLTQLLSAMVNL